MKAEMFDKIVKARTDQLVDRKISDFTDIVYRAIKELLGNSYPPMTGTGILDEEAKVLLEILGRNRRDQKWPRSLWENEGKKVADALLKTFDEFTQARLAEDKAEPLKNKMEEEEKPEAAAVLEDDNPF